MNKISIKLQSGVSIITAIFLLVVLSTLGAMMVTFFSAQQQSSALDMMGSRAYQAAKAGVEWSAGYIAMQPQDQGCTGITTPLFSAGQLAGTLGTFAVNVTCASTATEEDGTQIFVYNITSTATGGGAPGDANYVERVINVTIGR